MSNSTHSPIPYSFFPFLTLVPFLKLTPVSVPHSHSTMTNQSARTSRWCPGQWIPPALRRTPPPSTPRCPPSFPPSPKALVKVVSFVLNPRSLTSAFHVHFLFVVLSVSWLHLVVFSLVLVFPPHVITFLLTSPSIHLSTSLVPLLSLITFTLLLIVVFFSHLFPL